MLCAGKLGQQAQLGIGSTKAPTPAQVSPQIATNLASKQREQNLAQQQQTQLQQRATREAGVQDAKEAAQNIVKMPVKQQAQAVEQLKAQAPAPQRSSYQPSKANDLAIGAVQASTYLPQVMFAGTNALTGGKLSELAKSGGIHPQNFRDALERFKTPQQVEAGVPQADKPAPNLGMMNNPNTSKSVNINDGMIAKEARASQGIQEDGASALNPVYSEGVTRGNPDNKKFGLSVDNNAAVAQPIAPAMGGSNSSFGFTVMPAPRKAYREDSRRAALAMDIRPYEKMNGRLTTGQIALKNSIIMGDDEKYANEQYTTQMNAAQKLAQEGMTQSGANSRAQLTERGATSRAELSERAAGERQANQLGFDSDKFQQTLALDSRKLDVQQSNDKLANYGTKKLNEFREAWFNAKSTEEKTAIEEQMAILNPKDNKGGNYIAVSGGQAIDPETNAPYDLPMKAFNKDTGTFIDHNAGQISQQTQAGLKKIAASGNYSEQELTEIFDIAHSGGDIPSYLN